MAAVIVSSGRKLSSVHSTNSGVFGARTLGFLAHELWGFWLTNSGICTAARTHTGLGHMTLDAGGKGTLGIGFTEKQAGRHKVKR